MTMQVKVGELKEGDSFSVDGEMLWWRVWEIKHHGCGDVSITAADVSGTLLATERYDICHTVTKGWE